MEECTRGLATRTCKPCAGGTAPLERDEANRYLGDLPGWEMHETAIEKKFRFDNFHQTMAFANAVAWVAHTQDHHPDMELSYRQCRVCYSTHAIGGLSENDFISAARIEALLP